MPQSLSLPTPAPAAAVPGHRPARRWPQRPVAGALSLTAPPVPADSGGAGWTSALLPALGMLPIIGLGITGHGGGPLMLGLLLVPTLGGSLGMWWMQRRRQRSRHERARARWFAHADDLEHRASLAARQQRLAADRLWPDGAGLIALMEAGVAFERRPGDADDLELCVGVGQVPALCPVTLPTFPPLADPDPGIWDRAHAVVAASACLAAAPVTVRLGEVGILGVVGAEESAAALLASLSIQLAALHGPSDLALAGGAGQGWFAALPQARAAPVEADLAAWLGAPGLERRIAVLGAYSPGQHPLLDAALALPSTSAVVVCRSPLELPARTGAWVDVDLRQLHRNGPDGFSTRLDAVESMSAAAAAEIAAGLARLMPATANVPNDLVSLLAGGVAQSPLQVPVGVDSAGEPVVLDLREAAAGGHGPHGVLVGATGSGKSVLLRALVLGLAARHRVEELQLLLLDFKGGAAFAGLRDLPHVAGVVTNLEDDPGLIDRLAVSLGAELERRQRALRAAGLDAVSEAEPSVDLAPLLVVVDEAGELLVARPEMLDIFARIGRVGRSLGVHLLLSTQRWDEGRLRSLDAHLRYRLCLRTFTTEDSRAVIGCPDAATLTGRPGAGFLAYDGRLRRLQIVPPAPGYEELLAGVADRSGGASLPGARSPARARPVWQPPLPALLPWPVQAGGPQAAHRPVIGLLDLPARQTRAPLRLDLSGAGGHVALVGGPRSGVSSGLRLLIAALAAERGAADLAVHVLDLAGGLTDLAALPQVGTVAGLHQPALVAQVVEAVRTEVERRSAQTADPSADPTAPGLRRPTLLLVVDGVGLLRGENPEAELALAEIGTRGLAQDVHLLLGARRWSELRLGLLEAAGTRVELHLSEPSDSLVGRVAAMGLPAATPGRGLLADGTLLQLALVEPGQLSELAAADGQVPERARRTAPIRPLPRLLPAPGDGPGDGAFALGLCAPDHLPVTLDLMRPGAHLVVAGDPGSGRSTLLRRVVRQLAAGGPDQVALHLLDPRRSLLEVESLPAVASWSHTPTAASLEQLLRVISTRLPARDASAEQLRAARGRAGPLQVLVIDDLDLLEAGLPVRPADGSIGAGPVSGALATIAGLLPWAADVGLHLVVARSPGAGRFDGLSPRLRPAVAANVLLAGEHPELVGALRGGLRPGGRVAERPPGRALLLGPPDRMIRTGPGDTPAGQLLEVQCYAEAG